MLPSLMLAIGRFTGGLNYKTMVPSFKNMVAYISLARDKDSGSVYENPVDGRVRIKYPVNITDRSHIVEGLIGLAKMNYVEGAHTIFSTDPAIPWFRRSTPATDSSSPQSYTDDKEFQSFLQNIRSRCLPHPDNMLASAHQMGTCRMAADPQNGVVDPEGRVWETQNVYVCDASVFPSASGVNPMVTNMGITDWTSRQLARKMTEELSNGNVPK
jgi:choline dehydrogenase-like flavoprotein